MIFLKQAILAVASLWAVLGLANCTKYPLPVSGTGPAASNILHLHLQDASIIIRHSDGLYFRFTKSVKKGGGLIVANSPTLRGNWTYAPYTLFPSKLADTVDQDRNKTSFRSPEVHYINGLYYLYYTIDKSSQPHTSDICVATSPTMNQDDWTDHGSIGLPRSEQYTRSGPNLLTNISDPSGISSPPFLAFGSRNRGIYGIEMADPPLTIARNAVATELIANPPLLEKLARNNRTASDGPFQLQRGDYTYIFYSQPAWGGSWWRKLGGLYRIEVCRSTSRLGPYVDKKGRNCSPGRKDDGVGSGTVVVPFSNGGARAFGPGSVGVLNDPVQGLVLYFQYQELRRPLRIRGIRFAFNYLGFDGEDWPVLRETK